MRTLGTALLIGLALSSMATAAAPVESVRLGRAKDYMADEQWTRAIAELRAAIADPREKGKDEALYWLAHSLNQSGDAAAAIDTILRLEHDYPSSLWVKPAGSLRLDIAIRMQRNDVVWWTAVPTPPPTPPSVPPRAFAPTPPTPPANPRTAPLPPTPAPTAVPTPVAVPTPPGRGSRRAGAANASADGVASRGISPRRRFADRGARCPHSHQRAGDPDAQGDRRRREQPG